MSEKKLAKGNDKAALNRRLKRIEGQVKGIQKMIEDDRYCVDISNQIMAAQSLLKKSNLIILEKHLHTCVKDACMNDNGDEKIEEIISILQKVMSK